MVPFNDDEVDDDLIVPTDIESSPGEEPEAEALTDDVSGEASEIPAVTDVVMGPEETPPQKEIEPSEVEEPQSEPIQIDDSQVYGDAWIPPNPYPIEPYPNHQDFWTDSQPPEVESPSEYDKYTVEDKKESFQPEIPDPASPSLSPSVPERHLNPECEDRVQDLKNQIANLKKQRSSLFLVRKLIIQLVSFLSPRVFPSSNKSVLILVDAQNLFTFLSQACQQAG